MRSYSYYRYLVSDFYDTERPSENGLIGNYLCLDLLLNIHISKAHFREFKILTT